MIMMTIDHHGITMKDIISSLVQLTPPLPDSSDSFLVSFSLRSCSLFSFSSFWLSTAANSLGGSWETGVINNDGEGEGEGEG